MAAPGGKYFLGESLHTKHQHHESFEKLWTTKWRKPCSIGVYPFMFSAIQDFEPIVAKLIENDHKEPYDWDAYASTFVPKAEELIDRASEAEAKGNTEEASELYLRASAVYRISRFPAPRSRLQHQAWTKGKQACIKGLSLHAIPMSELLIPHTHAISNEGTSIPVYAHIPTNPGPSVILLTGLDGYRTELAVWGPGFASQGIATIVLEIPGTGDCPADASDPASSDRILSSVAAFLPSVGLDPRRAVVWGFSTGAYHVQRAAHALRDVFAGFVAQGGGAHHMFDPEWLDAAGGGEYPFDLGPTLAHKFGYGDDYAKFKAEAREKFSLLENGTLDMPCRRLLLVNGTEDSIFPVDDVWVVLGRGGPKEARIAQGRPHMGEPEAFGIILKWIYGVLGVEGDAAAQMRTVPFKPKFA